MQVGLKTLNYSKINNSGFYFIPYYDNLFKLIQDLIKKIILQKSIIS